MGGTVMYEVTKPSENNNKAKNEDEVKCNCCRNASKSIIFIITCIMIVLGALIISVFMGTIPIGADTNVCLSQQCIKSASQILDYIDISVDPCEDFYGFSCGKFLKNAYVSHTSTPIVTEMNRIKYQLDAMIFEPPTEDDSHMVKMQKSFFQSCRNLESIEEDRDKSLMNFLDKIGGWPVLLGQDWKEDEFDWIKITTDSRRLGLPFGWFLEVLIHETGYDYVMLSPPKDCTNLGESFRKEYLEMMVDIVEIMNGSRTTAMSELQNVLKFAKELSNLCGKAKTSQITTTSIKNLENLLPKINWFSFLQNITEGGTTDYKDMATIDHIVDKYIPDLDRLLIRTPKRVQANYFVWKTIEFFLPYLSESLRERQQEFNKLQMENCSEVISRTDFCVEKTKSLFHFISEIEYIRKYTDSLTNETVREMVELLKGKLLKKIENADWMDEETKKGCYVRMSLIQDRIGGHDEFFNEENFDRYLHIGNLNFSSDNIIEMLCEKSKSYYDAIFSGLFKRNKNMFYKTLQYKSDVKINAIFESITNTMTLPAPILHGFLYEVDRPNYLNYGGLGAITGHELVHSFGKAANQIATIGFLGLWNNKSIEGFMEASKCLIDDYDNFGVEDDINVNGSMTLEENYADAVGKEIAYEAYQDWIQKHGEELTLPGLPYTPNQLFWIQSGLFWCYKPLIGMPMENFNQDKSHGNFKYRNVSPLRNSRYFADDFDCPVDSYMNPRTKCNIL